MLLRFRSPEKSDRERSISANLQSAIARIIRRARFSAAASAAVPAVAAGAFTWILLRFAHVFGIVPDPSWIAAAALGAGVMILVAAVASRVPVTADLAVRELDRRAGASGRVIAAYELSGSSDPFAEAAVRDARSAVDGSAKRVPALFPVAVPARAAQSAILLLLAPVAALVLEGQRVDLDSLFARPVEPVAVDPFEARGDALARAAEALDLPTMAWAVKEARRILEPLHAPAATPTPVSVAIGPTPVPTRGTTITDPKAREFFDEVLSGATRQTVAREITERFTGEFAADAFKQLEAEFKTSQGSSGAKYDLAPEAGGGTMKLPQDAGGGAQGLGPAVDPSKVIAPYLKDKDQASELASALHESFEAYLKDFAAQMLKGMEDALENRLSGKGPAVGKAELKGLPDSPKGLAEERGEGSPAGPTYMAKTGGKPDASVKAGGKMALGGTAAGGTGAGAGSEGQDAALGGAGEGDASGERLDLGGTLDEKLAVVEVVRRMSGGVEGIDDSASAEVVLKTTKAAEAEAATAEEIPEEYRAAVERYFRTLQPASPEQPKVPKEKTR